MLVHTHPHTHTDTFFQALWLADWRLSSAAVNNLLANDCLRGIHVQKVLFATGKKEEFSEQQISGRGRGKRTMQEPRSMAPAGLSLCTELQKL